MSNNIYNILNNFNKVAAQDAPKPAEVNKPKSKLQESVEGVLSEKYMGFKKVAAAAKAGGAENPEAVAASIGRKKYGKEKFQKAAAAGKKLGEQRVDSPTIKGTDKKAKSVYVPPAKPPVEKLAKPIDEANDGNLANNAKPYDKVTRGDVVAGRLGKDEMGGKKKKTNKVEEAIQSLLAAGFTKEQIVEGWEEMMKDVAKRSKEEKGTGKFDKKKISTGTVHTRKYNPKSGESDDSENVTKEKRGRGRPKKSAFESKYSTVSKMITESFLNEQSTAPIAAADREKFMKSSDPQIFNKLTGAASAASAPVGTIKQGTWQADKPKAGQKSVPVPQNPEVAKEDSALTDMKRLAGLDEGDMEEGNEFSGALAKAKASGATEFQVGGKTYQVNECGMSPMGNGMMGQESAGKMNVSTNMSSDGNKSVTITADGDAALELMQMLKLAGMQGAEGAAVAAPEQEPAGVMVVSTGEEGEEAEGEEAEGEEEVDEEKDERYHASTTPDEHVEPVQSQTKGGNGDVAGQEKQMRKGGYQFGDNNLAMKEVSEGIAGLEAMGRKLYKEYESIKVQK